MKLYRKLRIYDERTQEYTILDDGVQFTDDELKTLPWTY
jgi:hypothetical protein